MVLRITETDDTRTLVATYLSSGSNGKGRIDIIKPTNTIGLWARMLAVFLPAGYPHSVTSDYMWYQIYVGGSSPIFEARKTNALPLGFFASFFKFHRRPLVFTSRARGYGGNLQEHSTSSLPSSPGVGVGDASASPTAALLLSVLQESMGRIATILFAHKFGSSLEPECKMYRLAADIFNDSAMVLDCLSPALPKGPRVILLSFSSMLRALCGVAGGSSKASLSAHFAKWGNLGELNAKDSSQETVISLMGMLAGSVVVSYVSTPIATWSCLILLLSIHLAMNRAAVRAVSMHSLNRQRANIVLSHLLVDNKVMTPEEVSAQERIFEWDGVLRWKGSQPLAKASIGVSLQYLLQSVAPAHHVTGAISDGSLLMEKLVRMYEQEEYLLWHDWPKRRAYVVLKAQASPQSQLKAWTHCLWTAHRLEKELPTGATTDNICEILELVRVELSNRWDAYIERMKAVGWDLQIANLKTTSGVRISVDTTGIAQTVK